MALNLIGPWGRVAEKAARSLRSTTEEPQVTYDVQMQAAITFAGDGDEGLHPAGSMFFTTESRAHKYERGLPRLARRVAVVSVTTGKVKRAKPAARPDEFKAPKKAAKKPAKKAAKKAKKR